MSEFEVVTNRVLSAVQTHVQTEFCLFKGLSNCQAKWVFGQTESMVEAQSIKILQ